MEILRGLPATKLIATHDLEMALDLCTRVVLLEGGKVVADGPAREVLGDAALVEAHGLEMPLSLMVRPGVHEPGRLDRHDVASSGPRRG